VRVQSEGGAHWDFYRKEQTAEEPYRTALVIVREMLRQVCVCVRVCVCVCGGVCVCCVCACDGRGAVPHRPRYRPQDAAPGVCACVCVFVCVCVLVCVCCVCACV
jgi:hypothetical protein